MRIVFGSIIIVFLIFSCSDDDNADTPPITTTGDRYNSSLYTDISTTIDVAYGSNINQNGDTTTLYFDFYEPAGDTETQRALVILAHGGGFTGGDKESMRREAEYLARSGYAVASISYRLVHTAYSIPEIKQAIIDAVFDMKSVIRFFRANATEYKINTDRIFIGGYSAGAFTALHTAYLSSMDEINVIDTTGTLATYVNQHGGLEGDSGNEGHSSAINGIINIAGAVASTSIINANEPTIFSVHGTNDTVVPYLSGESDESGITTEGSGLIHPRATEVGITNELNTIPGGGHDAFYLCDNCLGQMRSFIYENL